MPIAMILPLICCLSSVQAQHPDSIVLETVSVYGLPQTTYLSGSSKISLDSAFLARHSNSLLSESLMLKLPAYFRNRGAGMLSSISLRGTAPQHTNVLWNGININSFSLGQIDFSILPTAAVQQAEMHLGGGSTQFGSGAIGGSLLLDSRGVKQTGSNVFLRAGAGSFGQRTLGIGAQYADEKWELSLNTYRLQAENNFTVRPQNYEQPNAAWMQQGAVISAAYYFHANAKIELDYWQHYADRQVQLPMGSFGKGDEQKDKNRRFSFRYSQRHRAGSTGLQIGQVNDQIIFNGSGGDIDRWISIVKHEWHWLNWKWKTEIEWNRIYGNLSGYGEEGIVEDRLDWSLAALKQWQNGASLSVNVRKPWVTSFETPILLYAGGLYPLWSTQQQHLKLRASLSNNFRVPTLNDRFWQNAGDPNLLPEASINAEAGINWKLAGIGVFDITTYRYLVDNWIQWVPTVAGVWRPENVKQVLSRGIELNWQNEFEMVGFQLNPQLNYAYTSSQVTASVDENVHQTGKQLIYTPEHQTTASLDVTFSPFFFQFNQQWVGLRHTTTDNAVDYAIAPYAILSMMAGYHLSMRRHNIDFILKGNNLTNSNYQLFINHAMPGINFHLQLNYKLNL